MYFAPWWRFHTYHTRMLDMGADVNALDSYGNSGSIRFALQAKQILPSYNYAEHREGLDQRQPYDDHLL